MFIIGSFQNSNLYVMIKVMLMLVLIFSCEACYCILAKKAAKSYAFFTDQTSPSFLVEHVA